MKALCVGGTTMIGRDVERIQPELIMPHLEEHVCPSVKSWPEDEFTGWVVAHRSEVKTLVCDSPSYGEMAACRT